jgi:hypothetical protein
MHGHHQLQKYSKESFQLERCNTLLHATERSINLQMHDFCHWNKQEHHNKGMQPVLKPRIESSDQDQ